jgi:membrane protease YdiL (CAAX protease family)
MRQESVSMIGPLLFYLVYLKLSARGMGISPKRQWKFVALPICFLAAAWISRNVSYGLTTTTGKIIIASVCVGIAEESFFRGTMLKAFQGFRKPWYLLASSALFAFTHITYSPMAMLNLTIVGLAYGLARLAGIPLAVLVLVHAAHDVLFFMPNSTFNGREQVSFTCATIVVLVATVAYLSNPENRSRIPEQIPADASIAG